MPSQSPNSKVRAAWQQARSVIAREEDRRITQQEFLDVSFGVNPKTGKPYNPRTLRKWLNNERSAADAVQHSERDTFSFQQRVNVGGHDFAPTLTKPSGRSGLTLWTKTGRKQTKDAAKDRLQEIITQRDLADKPVPSEPPADMKDTDRYLRSTRGLKMRKARAVGKKRAGVIITRPMRHPISA